ncbi:dihydropteroate synthase [Oceanispirochaeta crateris]|uniref:Dihydropteroate synthase n=1 Tax=Oceanispirochaeta crateris TaxID=2518645 RepID=A0A5C1QKI8_9SPIO|nr:dihydropteroate synthase [Oceanispirochaeta crateris]QEN07838.1 dihydropteroate synthase [Oceanispirochaeta crateris]
MIHKNKKTLIMGIINCTPDSFYSQSRKQGPGEALGQALSMVKEGADILDLGGESTRPGASYVSQDEELERIIPVVEAIRRETDIPLSIDTRKSGVARAALNAGANIINDISALRDDPQMTPLAVEKNCPVILMHMQGTPENMQNKPQYESVVDEVLHFLIQAAQKAEKAGVLKENIVLDPGIGFGKTLKDNLDLIRHIRRFSKEGYSVLMGLSRKSFIGQILDTDPENRLIGSLTANGWCAAEGVDILRVHDVLETSQMVRMLQEISWKD